MWAAVGEYGFPTATAVVLLALFLADRRRLLVLLAAQGERITIMERERYEALDERHREQTDLVRKSIEVIDHNTAAFAANTAVMRLLVDRCPQVSRGVVASTCDDYQPQPSIITPGKGPSCAIDPLSP